MDILIIKEASALWGISERRITALCNAGRIAGAVKTAGVWLLPKNAEKPADARIKSGRYKNWRKTQDMKSNDFENNLRNLKGTFAVENMHISRSVTRNLKRIENGEASYKDVINELKKKYMEKR